LIRAYKTQNGTDTHLPVVRHRNAQRSRIFIRAQIDLKHYRQGQDVRLAEAEHGGRLRCHCRPSELALQLPCRQANIGASDARRFPGVHGGRSTSTRSDTHHVISKCPVATGSHAAKCSIFSTRRLPDLHYWPNKRDLKVVSNIIDNPRRTCEFVLVRRVRTCTSTFLVPGGFDEQPS